MRIGLFLFLAFLVICCSEKRADNEPGITIYQPRYAKNFKIVEIAGDTLIEIFKNGKLISKTSCKNKPTKLALFSTTHAHYVDKLNLNSNIVATVYGDRIDVPEIQAMVAAGNCVNWGTREVNKEMVMASAANGLLSLPYEGVNWTHALPQIPVLPMFEFEENHPLGRSEWLIAVGFFTGNKEKALAEFKSIEENYLKQVVAGKEDKKVAVLAYSGTAWTMAPEGTFWSVLLKDAGARYISGSEQKTVELDAESAVALLEKCDYYLEVNYRPNDTAFNSADLNVKLQSYLREKSISVFGCNTAQNGFFGRALLEPHVLLGELQTALNNQQPSGPYLQKLVAN